MAGWRASEEAGKEQADDGLEDQQQPSNPVNRLVSSEFSDGHDL